MIFHNYGTAFIFRNVSFIDTHTKFGNLDSEMKAVNKKVSDHATGASTGQKERKQVMIFSQLRYMEFIFRMFPAPFILIVVSKNPTFCSQNIGFTIGNPIEIQAQKWIFWKV